MANKRGIGDPLQIDELKGHNGYVDRIGSGLTKADVFKLIGNRLGRIIAITSLIFFLFFVPMGITDPDFMLFGIFFILFIMGFMALVLVMMFLCIGSVMARTLMENNYLLLLKDRLVIQSQTDAMMMVVRNEIPLSRIQNIELAGADYMEQRRRRTNPCTRFLLGQLDLPVAGLHPLASRKEHLMVIHLRSPLELRCSGRIGQGSIQIGDKREYVKELLVSVDPAKQGSLAGRIAG